MRINGNRADHDCNTATAMSPPHHRLEVGRRYHDDRRPSDRLGNPGGNTQQKLQKQPSTSTQASPKQLERQVTCGDAHFGPGRALILTAGHAQQHVAHPSSKCVIVDNAQDADACVRGVQARTKEALNRSKRRLERHDSRRCTAQQ